MASVAIRTFSYDEDRNELTVFFASGGAYVYALVPPAVFAAFSAAPSKGAFHNTHLRDHYPFRKVKPDAAEGPSLREALLASSNQD